MSKLLYIFLSLLIISVFSIDIINLFGVNPLFASKKYILGVPVSDLLLFFLLLFYIFKFNYIRKASQKLYILFVVFLFIYSFLIGLINNFDYEFKYFNFDIRVILWFFGGISIAYIFYQYNNIKLILYVYLSVFTVLTIVSSVTSLNLLTIEQSNLQRIAHPSLYMSSGMLLNPLIIFMLCYNNTLFDKIFSFIIVIVFFYFVAYLSATRSSALIGLYFIFIFIITSIDFSGGKKYLYYFIIFILVLFIIFSNFSSEDEKLTRIFFKEDSGSITEEKRFTEINDFFKSSTPFKLLFGHGMGGKFFSSMYDYDQEVTVMHVGIFNFWFKFGPFFFLFFFFTFIIYVPYQFLFYIRRYLLNRLNLNGDIKILYLASIIPWVISLLISGGYGESSSFLLAFSIFLPKYIRLNSVNHIKINSYRI